MSRPTIIQSIQYALATIEANEAELGKLDAAAGDGDHGAGMVRGMRAANEALMQADTTAPPGMLLMQAGSAFSDAAGGASGALFGVFFMTIGQKLGEKLDAESADAAVVHGAFQAGLEAIAQMGKAKLGDKTMLDTLDPFVTTLGDALSNDLPLAAAWRNALAAAESGALATRDMQAKRGRSSRLGERSIGHIDPGAMSMLYILQAVGAALDAS